MKLNIYDKKNIVKTYETDEYDLLWGVVTDVSNAVNLDELQTGSQVEIMKLALGLVMNSVDTVNELLKDMFDGLTDEELKHVKVTEVAQAIVDVITYTIGQLNLMPRKN